MNDLFKEALSQAMEQLTKEYTAKVDTLVDLSGQMPQEFKSAVIFNNRAYKLELKAVECEDVEAAKEQVVQWSIEDGRPDIEEAVRKSIYNGGNNNKQ